MKNKFIFIALLAILKLGNAQEAEVKTHEIGLNAFSVLKTPTANYYFASDPDRKEFQTFYFSGLIYKYHHNQNTWRVAFDYYHDNGNFSREEGSLDQIFDKFEVRGGYQYYLFNKKLKPFVGGDVMFSIERYIGWVKWTNPYDYRKFEDYRYLAGITPNVGLQYFFMPSLSLTLELNVMVAVETVDKIDETNTIGMRMNLNPIRLFSINYHF